jgi:hypothetical protein
MRAYDPHWTSAIELHASFHPFRREGLPSRGSAAGSSGRGVPAVGAAMPSLHAQIPRIGTIFYMM